jgi:hypothetical protein
MRAASAIESEMNGEKKIAGTKILKTAYVYSASVFASGDRIATDCISTLTRNKHFTNHHHQQCNSIETNNTTRHAHQGRRGTVHEHE